MRSCVFVLNTQAYMHVYAYDDGAGSGAMSSHVRALRFVRRFSGTLSALQKLYTAKLIKLLLLPKDKTSKRIADTFQVPERNAQNY